MIKISDINAPLNYDDKWLCNYICRKLNIKSADIISKGLVKKSVDARKKYDVHFNLSVKVEIANEDFILSKNKDNKISIFIPYKYELPKCVTLNEPPVVVGFGPAGMFAALILAQAGAKPVVIERGLDVDARLAAVKLFWKTGKLDSECNVQFGEGGAGTFSDGKLTTGTKDPRIGKVFEEFVRHGAPEEILWQAKPHIGTDMLSGVVKSIREEIIRLGGEVIFGAKLTELNIENNAIFAITYQKEQENHIVKTSKVILAVGHSARDIFVKLKDMGVMLSRKNFAVGVRVEHLQADINQSLYGEFAHNKALSAADYKYVAHLPNGRSMYTFCMCPGGAVVAAASETETVVTNGMSYFARDMENANSALLVGINPDDFEGDDVLAGVEFQRKMEQLAFIAGGKNYNAPVCLVGDFLEGKKSTAFGKVKPTYKPSTTFASPCEYLPDFVCESLRLGIKAVGGKNPVFTQYDGVITGVESRSSSPVRINRNNEFESVSVKGLYPCGEGAGYAGGIVSAAVDGIRCAEACIEKK